MPCLILRWPIPVFTESNFTEQSGVGNTLPFRFLVQKQYQHSLCMRPLSVLQQTQASIFLKHGLYCLQHHGTR